MMVMNDADEGDDRSLIFLPLQGTGLYRSSNGTPELMFTFRDADEVFREAFEGQDPFTETFGMFA